MNYLRKTLSILSIVGLLSTSAGASTVYPSTKILNNDRSETQSYPYPTTTSGNHGEEIDVTIGFSFNNAEAADDTVYFKLQLPTGVSYKDDTTTVRTGTGGSPLNTITDSATGSTNSPLDDYTNWTANDDGYPIYFTSAECTAGECWALFNFQASVNNSPATSVNTSDFQLLAVSDFGIINGTSVTLKAPIAFIKNIYSVKDGNSSKQNVVIGFGEDIENASSEADTIGNYAKNGGSTASAIVSNYTYNGSGQVILEFPRGTFDDSETVSIDISNLQNADNNRWIGTDFDTQGTYTTPTRTFSDLTSPTATALYRSGEGKIYINFSENMDVGGGYTIGDFTIANLDGGASVSNHTATSLEIINAGSNILNGATVTFGSNVKDSAGNPAENTTITANGPVVDAFEVKDADSPNVNFTNTGTLVVSMTTSDNEDGTQNTASGGCVITESTSEPAANEYTIAKCTDDYVLVDAPRIAFGSPYLVAAALVRVIAPASPDGLKTVYLWAKDSDGNTASGSDTITVDSTDPTASASPAGGTYTSTQIVTLSQTDTNSYRIYYTTDGSTPTMSSHLYSTPISLYSDTTLKFIAYDKAGNDSGVQTETYTISSGGNTGGGGGGGGGYGGPDTTTVYQIGSATSSTPITINRPLGLAGSDGQINRPVIIENAYTGLINEFEAGTTTTNENGNPYVGNIGVPTFILITAYPSFPSNFEVIKMFTLGGPVPIFFNKKVKVIVPLDKAGNENYHAYMLNSNGTWSFIDGGSLSSDGKTYTFETDHFSTFAIFDTNGQDPSDLISVPVDNNDIELLSATFLDIVNHWGRGYIEHLQLTGVVQGRSDGKFYPDSPITRAELLKMALVANSISVDLNQTVSGYLDVPTSDWSAPYIRTARIQNIVKTATNFRPGENITRSEALKILLEASELNVGNSSTNLFTDFPLYHWAQKYITYAVQNNIANGYTETTKIASKSYDLTDPQYPGMSGKGVNELQNILTDLGYYTGTITNYFDNNTKIAVQGFQKAKGLFDESSSAFGFAGPVTLGSLREEIVSLSSVSETVQVFRPEDPITRAEAAKITSAIINLLP